MSLQYSSDVRHGILDSMETSIGASAILKIRTGAPPANCAAADSGSVLATVNLPADWMEAAGATTTGEKNKLGTWEDASADATGIAGHFRLYASNGTTCHMQGTVTVTGAGGDMTVDNTSFTALQQFTITQFKLTAPGA